jgi:hypothetical protein
LVLKKLRELGFDPLIKGLRSAPQSMERFAASARFGPAFRLPEKPAAARARVRSSAFAVAHPPRTQKHHLVLATPGALGGGPNAGITALQAMSDRVAAAAAISTGLFMHDPTI